MAWWESLTQYWHEITAWFAFLDLALVVFTIAWVLTIKKEPTSAMAWCLLVLLLPVLGVFFFILFGYQHVQRPVRRKVKHKQRFRQTFATPREATPGEGPTPDTSWEGMGKLAQRFDAFPVTENNQVAFYYDGPPAFDAMLADIRSAKHHIHLEYFIFQPDATGQMFRDLLVAKAKEGVEVRLLFDSMGSHRLHGRWLEPLVAAGGKCSPFLPLNLFRRRIQVNLRNHRKIMVVDGRIGYTGGLNIGDEYLGKIPRFGYWRDTHLRARGPVVAALQRVFIEDWDFTVGEHLRGQPYFPSLEEPTPGDGLKCAAQVIQSGPDQDIKGIREIYFAAILRARQRLWIASPYFVPDAGLRDALCLAGYTGVDVRLLCQFYPDKWIPFFAGRYYWAEALDAGVKIYQYTKGMMHSKVMLVDGQWASVGSANLDNRSMHLNFELNCLIYSPAQVAELEESFRRDLAASIRLDREVFGQRPFAGRLIENACRLLSPVL